jgi:hypothetical protein
MLWPLFVSIEVRADYIDSTSAARPTIGTLVGVSVSPTGVDTPPAKFSGSGGTRMSPN